MHLSRYGLASQGGIYAVANNSNTFTNETGIREHCLQKKTLSLSKFYSHGLCDELFEPGLGY